MSSRTLDLFIVFMMLFLMLMAAPTIINCAKGITPQPIVTPANVHQLNVIVGDKENPQIRAVLIVANEDAALFLSGPRVWKLVVDEEFMEVSDE